MSPTIAAAARRPWTARPLSLLLALCYILSTLLSAAPVLPAPADPPAPSAGAPAQAAPALSPWVERSLLLGGEGQETITDVAIAGDGHAYIAGYTGSAGFPGAGGAIRGGWAAFVARLTPAGGLDAVRVIDGELDDRARAVALGPDGRVYLAGATSSPDFPVAGALQPAKGPAADAFVLRLSPDLASVEYGTFLGGSGSDDARGLAVGADGAIYLAGDTTSPDFPTRDSLREPTVEGTCYGGLSACTDIFVSKISPDGQGLVYSTYHGGGDYDIFADLAVDSLGRAYLFGSTVSDDLLVTDAFDPTYNNGGGCAAGEAGVPCSDLFVSRLTPDGRLDYGTYLGGVSAEYDGRLAVDGAGRAYVTARSFSVDYPLERPIQAAHNGGGTDAVVSVLSPDGRRLEFSSFFGGQGVEVGKALALGADGDLYLAGVTTSADLPTRNPLQPGLADRCDPEPAACGDLFVARIAADFSGLVYSSYLGGGALDEPLAIAAGADGGAVVAGYTRSPDLVPGGAPGGDQDAFVLRLTTEQLAGDWFVDAAAGSDLSDCRAPERACATIRAALARAAAGSTVNVAAGTYSEFLTVDRDVRLVGAGPATTILRNPRADGQTSVVRVEAGVSADLANLTLTGGDAASGGGLANAGAATLTNLIIRDNRATNGGGISSGGDLTVVDSIISGNESAAAGGGIRAFGAGALEIRNSQIISNTATSGGGILTQVSTTLHGAIIRQNRTLPSDNGAHGGGLHAGGPTLTIVQSEISANQSAGLGGAIYAVPPAVITISGSSLSGNVANGPGGALYAEVGAQSTIADSTVEGNAGGTGGGICHCGPVSAPDGGSLTVIGSTISGNRSSGTGGGIALTSASARLTIRESRVISNTAEGGGGGIYNNRGTLEVLDSTVGGNEVPTRWHGAGIFSNGPTSLARVSLSGNQTLGEGGGLALYEPATATIVDSTIRANGARVGGGLLAAAGTTLDLIGTTIADNTSAYGGGMFTDGVTSLLNSAVSGNRTTADPFGFFGGEGGGIIVRGGQLTVTQSEISENRGHNAGAGMYIHGTGVVTITRSTLSGNRGHVGGAIYAAGERLTVDSSTLSANQAGYAGAGIMNEGALEVTSSTFSANRSGITVPGPGSAIFSSGPTSIRFSTIVDNEVVDGYGALVNQNISGTNPFSIAGSIVAGNRASFAPDLCNFITSVGHNLIGTTTTANECSFTPATGDQVGTITTPLDPKLAPLAANGGPTATHWPQADSPAIDAAGGSCPATDQRGGARPIGAACDAGAVEWGSQIAPRFDPVSDTYAFRNSQGRFDPIGFFRDAGVAAVTHTITRTELLGTIRGDSFGLPIDFANEDLVAALPLDLTEGLASGVGERIIPRVVAWLYEEVIVSRLYEDPTEGDYAGAVLAGRCVGMAASLADFRKADGLLPATFIPTATMVRQLPPTDELLRLVDQYQSRQVGLDVLEHQLGPGRHDARSLYRHLHRRMSAPDWWENPEIIGIFGGDGCAEYAVGHALLPYKLEPRADGTARIYVYDSNYPPRPGAPERYITIRFAENRWSYPITASPADAWEGEAIFSVPVERFRRPLRLPYLAAGGDPGDATFIAVAGGVQHALGGRTKGAWGGRTKGAWGGRTKGAWGDDTYTGCLALPDGSFSYSEVVGRSMRLRPLSGATLPALVMRPPAGASTVTFSGQGARGDEFGDMLIFGLGGAMGFTSETAPGKTYSATVDLAFRTLTLSSDDRARLMSAFQMHEDPDGQATRIFAVSNVLVGASGAITMRVAADLGSVSVTNQGDEPVRVTLGLANIGSAAITKVTRDFVIQPGAEHTFTPRSWERLTRAGMAEEVTPLETGRVTEGLVARYDFAVGSGATVPDRAPAALGPELEIADPAAARWRPDGLELPAPTLLRAVGSSRALIERLRAAGAFSLEVWATPAVAQSSLGALASLGGPGHERNLVLFQKPSRDTVRFSGRVRLGGAPAGLALPDTPRRPATGRLVHLVVTHARGVTRIYVDGELAATARHSRGLEAWDPTFSLTLGNTLAGDRPWLGTYHLVAIYEQDLSPTEVRRNFLAGARAAE